MCDFIVVNSKKHFKIDKYLAEVVRRRRLLKENEHGWGVFFDDGENWVLMKEPLPAWTSPFFLWFENRKFDVKVRTLIIHVRKATHGKISWFNTHPFIRELNGKKYAFAHKGDVSKYLEKMKLKKLKPSGQTDSEHLFLYILEQIEDYDNLLEASDVISELGDKIEFENRINFFLYDGEYLVVFDGRDNEPLYYESNKDLFIASSEEFREAEMGQIGESRLLVVKDGKIIRDLRD